MTIEISFARHLHESLLVNFLQNVTFSFQIFERFLLYIQILFEKIKALLLPAHFVLKHSLSTG